MKETVNVNIGSQAFTLDEDAYRVLRNYLEDIRSRLPEYDTETMGDIEARIAEIFREIVSSPMRVITLDTVRQTMNRMEHTIAQRHDISGEFEFLHCICKTKPTGETQHRIIKYRNFFLQHLLSSAATGDSIL